MKMVVFALAFCAFAQDTPPVTDVPMPEVGPLGSFLRGVDQDLRRDSPSGTPTVSPRDVKLAILREELRCADDQVQAIQEAAGVFVRGEDAIRRFYGNYVFEARLEITDTGRLSEAFLQKMERMKAELADLESQAGRQLTAVLGDERFRAIDAWVRSPESKRCRMAPCVAKR